MADTALPAGFRFGVATAGFQVEGGFNGPGEPANNWADWEREGRVEPSGQALRFWDDFEMHLDAAVAAGCDAFRLSVEWARCQPAEESIDESALDRYAAILAACAERGLRPLVTLHHFTHPHWLGADFWLSREAPDRFAAWAGLAAGRLATTAPDWVTINEPNVLAAQTYLLGAFPPGRRLDVAATVRALDNMLTAHVLAYAAIKDVRPDARVSLNSYALSVYEMDRLTVDLLLARSAGVGRYDLGPWLADRRRMANTSPAPSAARAVAARYGEAALRRLAATTVPLGQAFPRAVEAIYESRYDRCCDVYMTDWYQPVAAARVRIPGRRTAGGRSPLPYRMLWDDPPDPGALTRHLVDAGGAGLPVWVAENGMCNRVRHGRSFPRLDGWDRPAYLRRHVAAVMEAIAAGAEVGAYFHWTLADNYEWGSYEPRFGLYGVDRDRGLRWSEADSMGRPSAAVYRRIVDGLRVGDRSVLEGPA